MPLKRTPPPSEHNLTMSSTFDQTSKETICSTPKFTIRNPKRRRSESGTKHFMTEMRHMFQEFQSKQSETIDKLCSAVEDLRSSVNFLSEKYDLVNTKLDKLESDRREDLNRIKTLEDLLEKSERNMRATCLEIRNIPVQNAETKINLINTVVNTGKAINLEIQPHEIKDVFRTKTKNPDNRPIIVDLTSVIMKEKIISAVRKFNKVHNKLSTEHLKITGPAKPVFISENLTSKMKRLFFLSRDFAKTNDYRFCWVSHGKIYLRKREGTPLIQISNDSDLINLRNQA